MNYYTQPWYAYIDAPLQALVKTSVQMLDLVKQENVQVPDYGFVTFPMVKAYEGFLKKYFFETDLINEYWYTSKKFRVGRALNPDVSERNQGELWLFDDVARRCGRDVARQLWDTWLSCRNAVFHYFPEKTQTMSLEEAEHHLNLIGETMTMAMECLQRTKE
jgi:hypothetical protein